jgi:hypothetical protein
MTTTNKYRGENDLQFSWGRRIGLTAIMIDEVLELHWIWEEIEDVIRMVCLLDCWPFSEVLSYCPQNYTQHPERLKQPSEFEDNPLITQSICLY